MINLGGKRGELSMTGPELVYPGSSNTYQITDFDAFSTYSCSAEFGTVSLNDDTITLTLPAEVASDTCRLEVSRNGRKKIVTLAVGSQVVRRPSIIAPADGTQDISLTPTIYVSDFATSPPGADTQSLLELEFATDELFVSAAYTATVASANKITVPPSTLTIDTVYHIRGRYVGSALGASEWSDHITVKTTAMAPGAVIDGDIAIAQIDGYWLLVAPATKRAQKRWGLYGTDTTLSNITSAASPDPKSGEHNTQVLTSAMYSSVNDGQGSIGSPAAEHCKAGGYYLPNKEELALIRAHMATIDANDASGGASTLSAIASSYIWTSTEYSSDLAWIQRLSDGSQTLTSKNLQHWVVPVRRFPV